MTAMAITPSETRFDRQLTVPGFGHDEQQRLRCATVLVAGVGGVGGAAATYLAAAGVGRLVLIHPGNLERPDLNRQTLMHDGALGLPRVETAVETLARHYPDVVTVAHDWNLDHPHVPELIAETDAVIDARHNFAERFLINHFAVASGTPLVVAAMNGTEANLMNVTPGSPCLRCVYPEGDPAWEPLGFPVFGAVAGTVGAIAAMEAVKLITGFGRPLTSMLNFDLADASMQRFPTRVDPNCGEHS